MSEKERHIDGPDCPPCIEWEKKFFGNMEKIEALRQFLEDKVEQDTAWTFTDIAQFILDREQAKNQALIDAEKCLEASLEFSKSILKPSDIEFTAQKYRYISKAEKALEDLLAVLYEHGVRITQINLEADPVKK